MNGYDILIIAACLVVLLVLERVCAWLRRVEYRKLERLAHRNMFRATGGAS